MTVADQTMPNQGDDPTNDSGSAIRLKFRSIRSLHGLVVYERSVVQPRYPRRIKEGVPHLSAHGHCSILLDRNRIARIHGFEELVSEEIDGDHAAIVPNVIDDQAPGRDAVDV